MSVCYYPCPCGYYGDPERECGCSLGMVQRYQKRISGPPVGRLARGASATGRHGKPHVGKGRRRGRRTAQET